METHSSLQKFFQNLLLSTKKVRFVICFSFFTLMAGALFAIIFFVYSQFISKISESNHKQIDDIAEKTFQQTKGFIAPLADIVKTIGWNIQDKTLFNSEKNITVLRSIDLFKALPQIGSFTIGSENGDAIIISPILKGTSYAFQAYRTLPENAKFLLNRIDRTKDHIQETYEYYDEFAQKIHSESRTIQSKGALLDETKNDAYDPRIRPWYIAAKQAGKTTWSELYTTTLTYIGLGRLMTVANPILDGSHHLLGAVATGIKLKDLAKFLKNQLLYPLETIFLFDQQGEVIVYADRHKAFPDNNQDDEKLFIKDITYFKIGEIYKNYLQTKIKKIVYAADSDDLDDVVYFFSLKELIGKDWGLCIVINGKDLLGSVQDIRKQALVFSGIIIVLALLLITLLSKRIAAPIQVVGNALKDLHNLKLDPIPPIKSRLADIQEMIEELKGLVSGLRSFGKFIPRSLSLQLLEQKEEVRVGGEDKEITILFTDIQDFTSISEKLPRAQLAFYLSDYFEEMTRVIQENKGTVDKYIGDAIMAFWGAPLPNADHAYSTCKAALLCQRKLVSLNKKWAEDKKPVLKTRFGIGTGVAHVGNTGSSDRLQYTALGDCVNLSARLEEMNKVYGTGILISEQTYKVVHEKFITRPVDFIAVKGQEKGGQVYELLEERFEDEFLNHAQLIDLAYKTEQAYELYRAHHWKKALAAYRDLHRTFPQDKLAEVFIKRCENFIETPPDPSWDGVFRMGGLG